MKNTKRQAFTIVELVIVIAVIAILSAVLIPTFGAIIKDANIAADQSAAATLTTELHVYLKGDYIESEAELVDVLAKSGIRAKLTPKAAAYGIHFWFDMETQTIIANTAAEIKALGEERAAVTASAEQTGAALMSATLIAQSDASANISFRDIYGIGIYLIDNDDASYISAVINAIDALNGETAYKNLITQLETAASEDPDKDFVNTIKDAVSNTTIRNDSGVFFEKGEKENRREYFSVTSEYISSTHYEYDNGNVTKLEGAEAVAPAPADKVEVPEHISGVVEGGLNYDEDTTIVIESSSVLAPDSTNAKVELDGETYTVNGNQLANVDTEKADDVITLNKKLTFSDFTISYNDDGDASKINVNEGKIYISYTAVLDFFAKDTAEGSTATSEFVNEWISSNPDVATVDATGKVTIANPNETNGYATTITAKAFDMSGRELTKTVEVVVNKPLEASIILAGQTYTLDGSTYELDWFYDKSTALTFAVNGNIRYKYDDKSAKGTNDITVKVDEGSIFSANEKNVTLTGNGSKDSVKVSVDGGLLETTFNINVIDNSKSTVSTNFYDKTPTPTTYIHYIGSNNGVVLGNLFNGNMEGATVNVYDAKDGDGTIFKYDANKTTTGEGVTASMTGATAADYGWTLGSNWASATLQLSAEADYDPAETTLTIKVSPTDGTAYVINVVLVKATNVNSVADMNAAFTAGNNVVLQSDVTVNTGTTINVGANTLYGNGYVINAKTFVGSNNSISVTVDSYTYCSQCDDDDVAGTAYTHFCTTCRMHVKNDHQYWCEQCGSEKSSNSCDKYKCSHCSYEGNKKTHKKDGSILIWADNCTAEDSDKHKVIDHKANNGLVDHSSSTSAKTEKNGYVAGNYYLISINGGTIDNIYLDGPVYPNLQYKENDFEQDGSKYANTAYYVTGIMATGSSTIKNSYATGFRQPVQAAGELLTVDNTTLRGGNYANLLLSAGNLNVKNVTTVQDQNGQQATVGNTNKYVLGTGIAIGTGALNSTITINGYLNQHNWVKQDTLGSLPIIDAPNGKKLDLKTIFGYVFKGMEIPVIGQVEIGSVKPYIHKDQTTMESDETKANNNYVNAGIVFCELGDTDWQVSGVKIVNGADRNKGIMASTVSTAPYRMRFSEEGYGSVNATTILGTDGVFAIWSYTDGRGWERSGLKINLMSGSKPTSIVDTTLTKDPSASIDASNFKDNKPVYVPVVYRGRYDNLGIYTTKYVVNDNNRLTAN